MIKYASFNDLIRIKGEKKIDEAALLKAAKASKYDKNLFLSHSAKDNEYLVAVIQILENHGANVYVDNGDDRLPEPPSLKTAAILRDSVKVCKKFVVFVTTISKDSKWIPWELGLADGFKSYPDVALFPSAEHNYDKSWAEREYLGLYRRII